MYSIDKFVCGVLLLLLTYLIWTVEASGLHVAFTNACELRLSLFYFSNSDWTHACCFEKSTCKLGCLLIYHFMVDDFVKLQLREFHSGNRNCKDLSPLLENVMFWVYCLVIYLQLLSSDSSCHCIYPHRIRWSAWLIALKLLFLFFLQQYMSNSFFVFSNINDKLLFLSLKHFKDQTALRTCKETSALLSSAFYPHPHSHMLMTMLVL